MRSRFLAGLAQRVQPAGRTLPEPQRRSIVALAAGVAKGRGVTALFAGPGGTGKTMAAEVMAAELGLELYRIDLNRVISQYMGETEKNLERIFSRAETKPAVLLFDEADALFGKRTDVRDANDRFLLTALSALLARLEAKGCVVILCVKDRRRVPAHLPVLNFP